MNRSFEPAVVAAAECFEVVDVAHADAAAVEAAVLLASALVVAAAAGE